MNKQDRSYERYQRQVLLSGFGEEGQQKLSAAKVLVIGAGGLGCPALQYLAAAGIGHIGIVDDDVVSLHNLHRQIIFTTNDIGKLKTDVAAERLHQINPDIIIRSFPVRLTNKNAIDFINDYNLVLDASDNFATRYLVNDTCVLLQKSLVYGAISQFEGQVAVFSSGANSINYRDIFPEPPQPGTVLNCAEAGVIGVLPGIIGTMQAAEAIKLITGIGQPLINRLFTYNALTNESFVFDLTKNEKTSLLIPKTKAALEATDYEASCEFSISTIEEIDSVAFQQMIQQTSTTIIDVREDGEQPEVNEFDHEKLPLSSLKENVPSIASNTIVVFASQANGAGKLPEF